jgi:hypothetical protein
MKAWSECMYPRFLDLYTSWSWVVISRPGRFTPPEKEPTSHWIGGWLGPRAGLDDVKKRNFLTVPGVELRFLCGSYIWWVAGNILSKQPLAADNRWSSSFGLCWKLQITVNILTSVIVQLRRVLADTAMHLHTFIVEQLLASQEELRVSYRDIIIRKQNIECDSGWIFESFWLVFLQLIGKPATVRFLDVSVSWMRNELGRAQYENVWFKGGTTSFGESPFFSFITSTFSL